MSNFDFLQTQWNDLAKLGSFAEKYVYSDANSSIIKQGLIGETIVRYMLSYEGIGEPPLYAPENTHANRIRILQRSVNVPQQILDILNLLRKNRNVSAHEASPDQATESQNATDNLRSCFDLCVWFMQIYGDKTFLPSPYVPPVKKATIVLKKRSQGGAESAELKEQLKDQSELEAEICRLREKLAGILQENKDKDEQLKAERRKDAYKYANQISLTEAQTRALIDTQLSKCGWIVSTPEVTYGKGSRPEKGKNKAIAEWPTDSTVKEGGRADYALFVGEKLVGIIEAKRASTAVSSVLDYQCKEYAKSIKAEHRKYVIQEYGDYKVPFLYATNGRPYLKQVQEESGIWFLDARNACNTSKALQGWPTPDGLMQQLEKDIAAADEKLKNTGFEELKRTDNNYLGLRKYQIEAIKACEEAIAQHQTEVLIAMATGTGKTRTVLGMIYRFLSTGRFKRILYLVDRHSLGEQTMDTFKEVKLTQEYPLSKLYDIKELKDKEFEKDTKVHIATVQGLIKRLLFNEGETMLGVSDYDLVIVDEAHRGYILDKQMSQDELLYRNQDDFQSKYRKVIEYFDAVKIALTATPAVHTKEIFGAPVYEYTYRQAVVDGYLADFDAPYIIKTELSEKGITFEKGSTPQVYNPEDNTIINGASLPDELQFDVEDFNRRVLSESFNKTVLTEVAKNIDPTAKGKTLIYAVNDLHADTIVNILRAYYTKQGVTEDAILKITGSVANGDQAIIQEAIRKFKNEQNPNIVVTVDLLTTGIDVPKITNLVFMRCVRSRILYEQMLGRATRRCPEIGKETFNIFDAVGIYDAMQKVSNMKPVVQGPKTSFKDLVDGLIVIQEQDDPQKQEKLKNQTDIIKAKINRKSVRMSKEDAAHFESLTKMTVAEFKEKLAALPTNEAIDLILQVERAKAFDYIRNENPQRPLFVSTATDTVTTVTRGYGKGVKPQDYLEEFRAFITDNVDKIDALTVLATRPSDLTLKALKDLKLALDREYFTETMLQSAWKDMTNQEIAADIISFIRQKSLDEPLISTKDRIHNAIEKTKAAHPEFTLIQNNWLDNIEKQLLTEPVLNKETFSTVAFRNAGGFKYANGIFDGKLLELIKEINDYIYAA